MLPSVLYDLSACFKLINEQIIISIEAQHSGAVYEQYLSMTVTSVVVTKGRLLLYFLPTRIETDLEECVISRVEVSKTKSIIDINDGTVVNVYHKSQEFQIHYAGEFKP